MASTFQQTMGNTRTVKDHQGQEARHMILSTDRKEAMVALAATEAIVEVEMEGDLEMRVLKDQMA